MPDNQEVLSFVYKAVDQFSKPTKSCVQALSSANKAADDYRKTLKVLKFPKEEFIEIARGLRDLHSGYSALRLFPKEFQDDMRTLSAGLEKQFSGMDLYYRRLSFIDEQIEMFRKIAKNDASQVDIVAKNIARLVAERARITELGPEFISSKELDKSIDALDNIYGMTQSIGKEHKDMADYVKAYSAVLDEVFRKSARPGIIPSVPSAKEQIKEPVDIDTSSVKRSIEDVMTDMKKKIEGVFDAMDPLTLRRNWNRMVLELGPSLADNVRKKFNEIGKDIKGSTWKALKYSFIDKIQSVEKWSSSFVNRMKEGLLTWPAKLGARLSSLLIGKGRDRARESEETRVRRERGTGIEAGGGILGFLFKGLKSIASSLIAPLRLAEILEPFFTSLQTAFAPVLGVLQTAIMSIASELLPAIEEIMPAITEAIQAVMPPVMELVRTVLPMIVHLTKAVLPVAAKVLSMLIKAFTKLVRFVAKVVRVLTFGYVKIPVPEEEGGGAAGGTARTAPVAEGVTRAARRARQEREVPFRATGEQIEAQRRTEREHRARISEERTVSAIHGVERAVIARKVPVPPVTNVPISGMAYTQLKERNKDLAKMTSSPIVEAIHSSVKDVVRYFSTISQRGQEEEKARVPITIVDFRGVAQGIV